MAHTATEQTLSIASSNATIDEIRNMFVDKFGWTLSGDTVTSNIDPNFSIKIAAVSWWFEFYFSGTTTAFLKFGNVNSIHYHISQNEKVIYIRFDNGYDGNFDLLIAYDENGNANCYYQYNEMVGGAPTQNISTYYTIAPDGTSAQVKILGGTDSILPNAIFKTPNFKHNSLCAELYSVINVQSFADRTNTYLSVGGKIFRIVSCNITIKNAGFVPTFAFPVSD